MFELIENFDPEALFKYLIVRMTIVLLCWFFVLIANFVDFLSGRATARALGVPVNSKGYRRTFRKVGDYYRVLIFALLFDCIGFLFPFYKLPFATILGSLAVFAIEGLSVLENSRKKKSHAAEIPEMVKKIIQCATVKDGKKLLEEISAELQKK